MRARQDFVEKYGAVAGPMIERVLRSRAAYKGVSTRRRHLIEALNGPKPMRGRRAGTGDRRQPLLPFTDGESGAA